jgi:hypothetical protein
VCSVFLNASFRSRSFVDARDARTRVSPTAATEMIPALDTMIDGEFGVGFDHCRVLTTALTETFE